MPPGRGKTTFPTYGNGNPNHTSYPEWDGQKAAPQQSKPKPVQTATLKKATPPQKYSFSQLLKMKKQATDQAKTELASQHGDKFTKLPKWAQEKVAKDYLKTPKPDGTFFTPQQEAQAARIKFKNEGGTAGSLVRGAATSLVPKTVVDIGQGKPVTGHGVVADLGNLALNFAPEGKAAAGLFGGFKGFKGIRGAAKAIEDVSPEATGVYKSSRHAEIQSTIDELTGKTPKPPEPYMSSISEGLQTPGLAPEKGFSYHRASSGSFENIRRQGLRPNKPALNHPSGVYFSDEPLRAKGLAQKSGKSVYLRVSNDAADLHPGTQVGEVVSHSSILPSSLEYLGADGGWHPLSGRVRISALTADAKKEVRQSLTGATKLRREQDVLYSQERGKRASAAQTAMQEQGGLAGYKAGLGKLKGELPKLKFGGFENFDQGGLDSLLTHIQDHPTLRPYEKIRTQGAILNVLQGKVPTKSELRLLHTVFGSDVASRIHDSIPFWKRAKNAALETLNVPRSLMSSFDLSAPFRQGLVVGVTHPKLFFKNFAPMVKAFGSENVYRSIMEDIASRPTYGEMKDAKVALTDMGSLDSREEQFMSNYAEHIPVIGRVVKASDRAYIGFLNKTRADLFDYLLESAHGQGISTTDTRVLESIGKFVNSATGRGDLGAFQKHATTLNTLFFSPRLLASRLNFLNPLYYARLDPFARREALKAARNLVATMTFVLYIAKQAGAQVNDDPRNADFAKIKIGNTRIDLAGGFQQPVRLLAQVFGKKVVSSTTGKTLTLGPEGPGKLSQYDIIERFIQGKLGPVPSLAVDKAKGTDFIGQPFSWRKEAAQRMTPLLLQDVRDLERQEGIGPALGGYAVGSLGFGVQSYGPRKPKGKYIPTAKKNSASGGIPSAQIPAANLKNTQFPTWNP